MFFDLLKLHTIILANTNPHEPKILHIPWTLPELPPNIEHVFIMIVFKIVHPFGFNLFPLLIQKSNQPNPYLWIVFNLNNEWIFPTSFVVFFPSTLAPATPFPPHICPVSYGCYSIDFLGKRESVRRRNSPGGSPSPPPFNPVPVSIVIILFENTIVPRSPHPAALVLSLGVVRFSPHCLWCGFSSLTPFLLNLSSVPSPLTPPIAINYVPILSLKFSEYL